jgi:hypothetical protein
MVSHARRNSLGGELEGTSTKLRVPSELRLPRSTGCPVDRLRERGPQTGNRGCKLHGRLADLLVISAGQHEDPIHTGCLNHRHGINAGARACAPIGFSTAKPLDSPGRTPAGSTPIRGLRIEHEQELPAEVIMDDKAPGNRNTAIGGHR